MIEWWRSDKRMPIWDQWIPVTNESHARQFLQTNPQPPMDYDTIWHATFFPDDGGRHIVLIREGKPIN